MLVKKMVVLSFYTTKQWLFPPRSLISCPFFFQLNITFFSQIFFLIKKNYRPLVRTFYFFWVDRIVITQMYIKHKKFSEHAFPRDQGLLFFFLGGGDLQHDIYYLSLNDFLLVLIFISYFLFEICKDSFLSLK